MFTLHTRMRCLALGTALSIGSVVAAQPASFEGLGTLPDTDYSKVAAISADGTTVVGTAFIYNCQFPLCPEAFRCTAATGMTGLGYPPGAGASQAFDVSADGSIIVGGGYGFEGDLAWRWTQASGFVQLPAPNNTDFTFASTVSDDGQVIAGHSVKIGQQCCPDCYGYSSDVTACRWIAGDDLDTPNPLPGYTDCAAYVVSGDGQTVLGSSFIANCNNSEPASSLWIGGGSAVPWSDYLSNGFIGGGATGTSLDGSVIVGGGLTVEGERAFRWTAVAGMANLGVLPGYTDSAAHMVSADGSVVVGACVNNTTFAAAYFIWDPKLGMRNLWTTLVEQGADLSGWTFTVAVAISGDGQTIVGNGISPSGDQEAWIAVLGNPSVCAADLSNDGSVGPADLAALLAAWGPCSCDADFNSSGSVGADDLAELLASWGSCP